MSGMVSGGRDRKFYINPSYVDGYSDMNEDNDAADQIISSPDRFLLSQEDLFNAEGGWGTFAMIIGGAAVGAVGVIATNGRIGSYLARGNLRFREWLPLGVAAFAGGVAGQQVGVRTFGDYRAYQNHWLAYTMVKSQNRYDGKNCLSKAPLFF